MATDQYFIGFFRGDTSFDSAHGSEVWSSANLALLSSDCPNWLTLSPIGYSGLRWLLVEREPPCWAEGPSILSSRCNSVCTAGSRCLCQSCSLWRWQKLDTVERKPAQDSEISSLRGEQHTLLDTEMNPVIKSDVLKQHANMLTILISSMFTIFTFALKF